MPIATTDWVAHHARVKRDYPALIDLHSKREFSYGQMHDRVGRVAGMLRDNGVKRGDRVAFLMLNSTDLIEIVFGCWRIGAICVALNFRLTASELTFILNNSETDVLIYDSAFAPLMGALQKSTEVKHYILSDCAGGDTDYEKGLASTTPVMEMIDQTLNDSCLLMYSSGTTGTPKGVIITHGMMYFTPASGARAGGTYPDNVTLSNMPLFHIGALNVTGCPSVWIGGTQVIMRVFDPQATLDAINDPALGVTSLFMVPAAYNVMRTLPGIEDVDFSRIRNAITGAETVPTELVNWWYEKGVVLQEGYGMTETAAAGCILMKEDVPDKVGSAGRALMHSQIKIVDDAGQTCAPNVPGEIWFKGAAVTPGYWKRPEANAESFVDGWFRSGDIGRMDADGYIYIDDRMKDMYISGGENVYPAEIENLLYQMPQIAEVAVIGVKSERWGETGCAVAVLKSDCALTLEDVLEHIGEKVAKFKQPQHVYIVAELPRNATGKVLKFELRKSVPEALGID
ncbi:MAG: acyl-CoA synthetase [Alphaproteobacteria bacterium]